MIFLRLLGPDLVAERDAELLFAFPERGLVGQRPRPELPPDLPGQDRHQGRRQRSPGFERAFGLWPQHPVHPVEYVRRAATDQGADRRVGPHLIELPPETEIAIGGPAAEQIGARGEMAVQQREHLLQAGLDLRRGCGVRPDEPDPVHHARADLAGEFVMLRFAGRGCAHPRNAAG